MSKWIPIEDRKPKAEDRNPFNQPVSERVYIIYELEHNGRRVKNVAEARRFVYEKKGILRDHFVTLDGVIVEMNEAEKWMPQCMEWHGPFDTGEDDR